MKDLPPWERVRIASTDYGFPNDGHIVLGDGRRIVVPGDHRCVVGPDMHEDSDARSRWRDMARLVGPGRTARLRILDGRMIAVGESFARMHPVDMAILSALGLDTEGAMQAVRDYVRWMAPDIQPDDEGGWPDPFSTSAGGRFSANFEIDGDTLYDLGELSLANRTIPESAIVSLVGRQLHDLVEIPALAGMDLPIVWIGHQQNPFTNKPRVQVILADDAGWVDFLDG